MSPSDQQVPGAEVEGVRFPLWSDDPATTDLLAFAAVAETLTDAVLDDELNPVALGVSGRWGSGKTTVLRLIEAELARESEGGARVLPIVTDPWRYDPSLGAKESLITEVLDRLGEAIDDNADTGGKAKALLERLAKRVDWAKAIKLAAKTAVSPQIPSIDSLLELVKPADPSEHEPPRTMDGFREEFEQLLDSEGLVHVRRVVVLVDDLDRCLPPTVVETLETIRLFLAVPRMSFVIAADEERVAEAIADHFPAQREGTDDAEHPSRLYLHKIVQTTIPLPALSRFDTQAYLLLLQASNVVDANALSELINRCADLRSKGATLDELESVAGIDLAEALSFAARLTPILYEKLKGNPRRIKRFLNDLYVRQSVAARRGINLDAGIVAKLMVLEQLVPEGFKLVLDWMANGELRSTMAALEEAAGRPPVDEPAEVVGAEGPAAVDDDSPAAEPFPEELIRWAKLPPPLSGVDLSPYLHLAAGFSGTTLLDQQLPLRLRDLAANLLSDSRVEQRSVTDADLVALRDSEPGALVMHLGRAARDRPREQRQAVLGILRILAAQPGVVGEATRALKNIPASEVEPAAVLQFDRPPRSEMVEVLQHWRSNTDNSMTRGAIDDRLGTAN